MGNANISLQLLIERRNGVPDRRNPLQSEFGRRSGHIDRRTNQRQLEDEKITAEYGRRNGVRDRRMNPRPPISETIIKSQLPASETINASERGASEHGCGCGCERGESYD